MTKLEISLSHQQKKFIDAMEDEVLYGGAAGGGKSHGQLVDALLYALRYAGSRQLLLRRTFPELEKSLIQKSFTLNYLAVATYKKADKRWEFANGSVLEFGYCAADNDVYQYQSAEYDVVRFDELTHFTEFQYTYLGGRVRGANDFPKQIKSSTNPGNIGHAWVKKRFIDPGVVEQSFPVALETGQTVLARFIPAKIKDNPFLLKYDPHYQQRLERQGETQRRMLIDGEWDVLEGRYFTNFRREVHVIPPRELPAAWRRYVSIDYGRDRFAALFFAIDEQGRAIQYREVCESDLIVSQAARLLKERIPAGESIRAFFAPPDLWNKHNDSGKSTAEIFGEHGVRLSRASNDRVSGWRDLAEWLEPFPDEQGELTAGLRFFSTCRETLYCLPLLQHDLHKPEDVANEPHELTHAPDALRYFIAGRPAPAPVKEPPPVVNFSHERRQNDPRGPGGYGDSVRVI